MIAKNWNNLGQGFQVLLCLRLMYICSNQIEVLDPSSSSWLIGSCVLQFKVLFWPDGNIFSVPPCLKTDVHLSSQLLLNIILSIVFALSQAWGLKKNIQKCLLKNIYIRLGDHRYQAVLTFWEVTYKSCLKQPYI